MSKKNFPSLIRHKETNSIRRERLINYAEKVVFPKVLDEYWNKCFQYHQQSAEPKFILGDPFVDIFKVCQLKEPIRRTNDRGEKEIQEISYMCVIPAVRWYWDIILSLYHLYAPEVYPTFYHVCKDLYECLDKVKNVIPFESIDNYNEVIHGYLKKNADIDQAKKFESNLYSFFITNPGKTVFEAMRVQVIIARTLNGDETDEELRALEEKFINELLKSLKTYTPDQNKQLLKELERYGVDKIENIMTNRLKGISISKLVDDIESLKEKTIDEAFQYMTGKKK